MKRARWKQIDQIFHGALDREPSARAAYLDEICQDDDSLRAEVEGLIASHEQEKSLFETLPAELAAELLGKNAVHKGSIAHYKLVKKIGAGGMGEVYLAVDMRLHRNVALKLLPSESFQDKERIRRFEREARSVSALNHPNILTIYDVGRIDSSSFIASQFIDGETLRQRLRKSEMPLQEILTITIQVAEALDAAHQAGIIHRDIKPENIMLRNDGYVKVVDFGLAKLIETPLAKAHIATRSHSETQSGIVLGTVKYMSPEQARGLKLDARSDIFSLGVVLYEMIAGRPSFDGATSSDVLVAILQTNPPALPTYEDFPELQWIITKVLAKDPEERYQTIKDLLSDLKRVRKQLETDQELTRSGQRSIAVLPFSDMSQAKDQDYFCEGMAEEIINGLAKIPDLKVPSRISSFQFKNQSIDVREIGKRLGVATVLEGSVRKSGERLRIMSQLINVTDGYNLWSEKFDCELRDVFEIQEEIAQAIVSALAVIPNQNEKNALKKQRTKPQAYEFYLRGKAYMYGETRKNLDYAVEMFERAIECDPHYAPAYAGLCDTLCHSFNYWGGKQENLKKAEAASCKALELAPDLPETHASHGHVLSLLKHYVEGNAEFEIALEKDPRSFYAHYFYARALWAQGKMKEGAAHFESAAQIRPEDFSVRSLLRCIFRDMKRPVLVKLWARRALEAIQPWVQYHPDDSRALYKAALLFAELGEKEKAVEWARKSIAIDPEDAATYYNIACAYGIMNDIDNALDMLEKAIEKGFKNKSWIEHDGDLVSLRGHPRYVALLNRLPDSISED